ncbi:MULTISPECIES: hypothetical protein [unclassified Escherichia]|uniref:hypothetical protein n=1 Tax=unclassified Escherichia TaxID=2608889 RepID=UPI001F0ECFE0|nr:MULTISPECIES: hypothetical protein [unclassified Escherichia]
MAKELSGALWVSRFPGSSSTNDLQGTFRASVDNFLRVQGSVSLQHIALPLEHISCTGQLTDIKYDISLSDVVDIPVNDVRFLCSGGTAFTTGCTAFSE